MKMKWLVSFGGGIGPNVWDDEEVIEAETLREALDLAEPGVIEAGGFIDSIEIYEGQ